MEHAETKHLERAPACGPVRSAHGFDLPTDEAALLRHYTLSDDDIEQIRARRGGTTGWASRSSLAPFDIGLLSHSPS